MTADTRMQSDGAVAITGAGGFFGWHLRGRLRALRPGVDVRVIDRSVFSDGESLANALQGVDSVIHLAGANRGLDDDVYETNVALARRLVSTVEMLRQTPQVVYAGSTHAEGNTAYGRSKRNAGSTLAGWGERAGAPVLELRFPNLFGECGRPDYNSAVATFCRDIAEGRPSTVNPEGRTELLHVQDACSVILDAVETHAAGVRRVEGQQLTIPDVYQRLQRLAGEYQEAQIPLLSDPLDLRLFNSLRTAMFPHHYPIRLADHRDARGMFAELARGHDRTQTSFSTTFPGVTRGEHYHLDKIERFIVLRGSAVIRLRRLFREDVLTFKVSGEEPVAVDMPPLYVHNITNVGDNELLTVFWSNDHFDPAAPDTYLELVEPVAGAPS